MMRGVFEGALVRFGGQVIPIHVDPQQVEEAVKYDAWHTVGDTRRTNKRPTAVEPLRNLVRIANKYHTLLGGIHETSVLGQRLDTGENPISPMHCRLVIKCEGHGCDVV